MEQVTDSMTVLYVGDGGTRSIIVWYVQKNEGYKIKLPHSIVDGCSENPMEDVFYMMLTEQEAGNYIYFTYLSSQDIFRTRTKDLQKRMNSKCIVNMGKVGRLSIDLNMFNILIYHIIFCTEISLRSISITYHKSPSVDRLIIKL